MLMEVTFLKEVEAGSRRQHKDTTCRNMRHENKGHRTFAICSVLKFSWKSRECVARVGPEKTMTF